MVKNEESAAEIVEAYRLREGRSNTWMVGRLRKHFPTLTPQTLSDALHGRRNSLYQEIRPYLETLLSVELPHMPVPTTEA